jgi:glycosyltransferase involved in cell wall biosynthesis
MFQSGPLVAVIVRVRNEEGHIGACLGSILRQDYPHEGMEVLVMDGMSTDRAPQVVRDYATRYPGIHSIRPASRSAQ